MKSVSLTIILLFFVQHSVSQIHQFYFAYGYNYPTATNNIGYDNPASNYLTVINGSFAKGPNIQLGYSLFILKNIGLDINYNYLIGFRDERIAPNNYSEFDNRASSIIPSIIIKTDIGVLSPYIKFGTSINFVTLKIKYDAFSNSETIYENDYSLGFSSSIGINCCFNHFIYLFTDVRLSSFTFYPTKYSTYTNGTISSFGSVHDDAYPFSSIGLSFGVKLEL